MSVKLESHLLGVLIGTAVYIQMVVISILLAYIATSQEPTEAASRAVIIGTTASAFIFIAVLLGFGLLFAWQYFREDLAGGTIKNA